jgi:hypothetical protein
MTITNGYCTLAEIKEQERLNITATTFDTALEGVIEGISRAIDYHCSRFFWKDTNDTTAYFTPANSNYLLIGDYVSITTLSVDNGNRSYVAWTVDTDYELWPYNALLEQEQRPYQRIDLIPYSARYRFLPDVPKNVKVVGKRGWPAVPKSIKEACLIWSMRSYKRYSTPLGVSAMTPLGEMQSKVPPPDPDVMFLLSPYVLSYIG